MRLSPTIYVVGSVPKHFNPMAWINMYVSSHIYLMAVMSIYQRANMIIEVPWCSFFGRGESHLSKSGTPITSSSWMASCSIWACYPPLGIHMHMSGCLSSIWWIIGSDDLFHTKIQRNEYSGRNAQTLEGVKRCEEGPSPNLSTPWPQWTCMFLFVYIGWLACQYICGRMNHILCFLRNNTCTSKLASINFVNIPDFVPMSASEHANLKFMRRYNISRHTHVTHVCTYVCMYVCIYVWLYVRMYVCLCVCKT